MRTRILVIVAVAALAGSAVVVAVASTSAAGLPKYTNGYQKWPKINKKPIRGGSPAHRGVKNVYVNKKKKRKGKYRNGTVIVKSIRRAGDRPGRPSDVAIMRKVKGRWRWVEYRLSGSRYTVLAQGRVCVSCHVQARKNDWVFTKR